MKEKKNYLVVYSWKGKYDDWEVETDTRAKVYEFAKDLTNKSCEYVYVCKVEAQAGRGKLFDNSGFEIKGGEE